MYSFSLTDPIISASICLTLLHSLWQVALLVSLARIADWLLPRYTAKRSYLLHTAVLFSSLLLVPLTFWWVHSETATLAKVHNMLPPVAAGPEALPTSAEQTETSAESTGQILAEAANMFITAGDDRSAGWFSVAPLLLAIYIAGVVLMLCRLFLAGLRDEGARRSGTPIVQGPLANFVQQTSQRWRIRTAPVLAKSQSVGVPKIVGLLRPTILLPAAALSGLSTQQLEMILAHELAHVRRHDLWINLMQRFAESILFFNPVLWYLSRRVSRLREYCCDDLAWRSADQNAHHSPVSYAEALLRAAELASPTKRHIDVTGLAASGRTPSELRQRIARLVGEPLHDPIRLSGSGILTVAAILMLLVCTVAWPTQAQTAKEAQSGAESKRENLSVRQFDGNVQAEVLAIGTHNQQQQQWWNAEAEMLDKVAFQWTGTGGKLSVQPNPSMWRRVAIRVHPVPEGSYVTWRIGGSSGYTGIKIRTEEEKNAKGYFGRYFGVAKSNRDSGLFDVTVGIATGAWKSVTRAAGRQAIGVGDGKSIVFSGVFKTNQGAAVVVSHNYFDNDFRVVAIDKQGQLHVQQGRGGSSAGGIYQCQATFSGLSPEDIARFEFQTRDYEWVEFKDLPLNPKREL